MAKISLDDPRFQPLKVEEEDKDKEKESKLMRLIWIIVPQKF